ncbi:MAG: hypothetical protein HY787_04445 [Deltaproteobacteria bacterium]|nr:hypothetical protein [Deltaproteobacteria bacterium]
MGDEIKENNFYEWEGVLKEIFKGPIPERWTWTDKKEMIRPLYFLGRNPELNQTYLPDGGRLHLKRGEDSAEPDCLDLHFVDHPVCIVKPQVLIFQSFAKAYEWAYFRLATKELEPSGWYPNLEGIKEELTEISPGDYADRKYWDSGSYEYDETGREIPLSSRARVVIRYFSGSFIIFAAGSTFHEIRLTDNESPSTITEEALDTFIKRKIDVSF